MTKAIEMISIDDAARLGIERLRGPMWSNPLDHIKIDIIDGQRGPWIHLYSPINTAINERDPVNILAVHPPDYFSAEEYVVYDGPLPESTTYMEAAKEFGKAMAQVTHFVSGKPTE